MHVEIIQVEHYASSYVMEEHICYRMCFGTRPRPRNVVTLEKIRYDTNINFFLIPFTSLFPCQDYNNNSYYDSFSLVPSPSCMHEKGSGQNGSVCM